MLGLHKRLAKQGALEHRPEILLTLFHSCSPQALAIREQGTYVCELKRVGTGHGVFHFDRCACLLKRGGCSWLAWRATVAAQCCFRCLT